MIASNPNDEITTSSRWNQKSVNKTCTNTFKNGVEMAVQEEWIPEKLA